MLRIVSSILALFFAMSCCSRHDPEDFLNDEDIALELIGPYAGNTVNTLAHLDVSPLNAKPSVMGTDSSCTEGGRLDKVKFVVRCEESLENVGKRVRVRAEWMLPRCIRTDGISLTLSCHKYGTLPLQKFVLNASLSSETFRLPPVYSERIPCTLEARSKNPEESNLTAAGSTSQILFKLVDEFMCPHPMGLKFYPLIVPLGEGGLENGQFRLTWTVPAVGTDFKPFPVNLYEIKCDRCVIEVIGHKHARTPADSLIDGKKMYMHIVDLKIRKKTSDMCVRPKEEAVLQNGTDMKACECKIRGEFTQDNHRFQTMWSRAAVVPEVPNPKRRCWFEFIGKYLIWRAKTQKFVSREAVRSDVILHYTILSIFIALGTMLNIFFCYSLSMNKERQSTTISVQTEDPRKERDVEPNTESDAIVVPVTDTSFSNSEKVTPSISILARHRSRKLKAEDSGTRLASVKKSPVVTRVTSRIERLDNSAAVRESFPPTRVQSEVTTRESPQGSTSDDVQDISATWSSWKDPDLLLLRAPFDDSQPEESKSTGAFTNVGDEHSEDKSMTSSDPAAADDDDDDEDPSDAVTILFPENDQSQTNHSSPVAFPSARERKSRFRRFLAAIGGRPQLSEEKDFERHPLKPTVEMTTLASSNALPDQKS